MKEIRIMENAYPISTTKEFEIWESLGKMGNKTVLLDWYFPIEKTRNEEGKVVDGDCLPWDSEHITVIIRNLEGLRIGIVTGKHIKGLA